jgi:hypothetical protein
MKVVAASPHQGSMGDPFDPFDPNEWGDKPGCSAFEIALEMRARNALAISAMPVLEVHLAACESCQEYGGRVIRVDASLGAAAAAAIPDWTLMREKMRKTLRQTYRTPLVAGAVALGMLILCSTVNWLFTHRMPSPAWMALSFFATMLGASCGIFFRIRRLRRLLAEPDPVAAHRRWLGMSLKSLRRFNRWAPLYLVLMSLQLAGYYGRFSRGDRQGGASMVLVTVALIAALYVIVSQRRAARRLARELAEMH